MRREKATIETFERCHRMPPSHPSKKLVERWTPKHRIKNKSILHHVQDIKGKTKLPEERAPLQKTSSKPPNKLCSPPEIETTLKRKNVTKKSDPVVLKYAADETIRSYPDDWTHVYTDGSAEEATKNAGWGIWIRNPNGSTEELFDACGANNSNYDAEVLAIQKSLDHLHHKLENNTATATNVVVFTDSLSALQAMEGGELDDALLQIVDSAAKLTSKYSVRLKLQWIPGHSGIWGNERADALARKGSQLSQPSNPITLDTAKQIIRHTYKREWMDKWIYWKNGI